MKILSVDTLNINEVAHFFNEDVVVIPTETVYGLAASIYNDDALKKIFKLKKRPEDNPLIVHVSSIEMLESIIEGTICEEYRKLIDKFWPGPLSLLFKARKSLSRIVTGGLDTVVIRMPRNKFVLEIMNKLNIPLAAPSANISGRPSPSTVQHAIEDFSDNVNLYIDGGDCKIGLESTVFSNLKEYPVLLRPGAVTREAIEKVLRKKVFASFSKDFNKIEKKKRIVDCYSDISKEKFSSINEHLKNDEERIENLHEIETDKIFSPGQKYKHYSPENPFILFNCVGTDISKYIIKYIETKNVKKIGILKHFNTLFNKKKLKNVEVFNLGTSKKEICLNIFKGLRYLDKKCDIIFSCGVDLTDEGSAIMDRLEKAAYEIIVINSEK